MFLSTPLKSFWILNPSSEPATNELPGNLSLTILLFTTAFKRDSNLLALAANHNGNLKVKSSSPFTSLMITSRASTSCLE